MAAANDTLAQIRSDAESFAWDILSGCKDDEDPLERVVNAIRNSDLSPNFWTAVIREIEKHT